MAHMMYSQHHAAMAPPQKPETFMLSSEAQQSLPQDAQVALQQVDNRKSLPTARRREPSADRPQ
jgi:transcription factor STE12